MTPVDFDPAKDLANRGKHGLSLAEASGMDWDAANIVPDKRFDYGELRSQAYGMLHGRLHVVAFTRRGGRLRIISVRRANAREIRRYGPADKS